MLVGLTRSDANLHSISKNLTISYTLVKYNADLSFKNFEKPGTGVSYQISPS